MNARLDPGMADRLTRLEVTGRRHLVGAARQAAWTIASTRAARAAVAGALVALLLGLSATLRWPVLVAAALVVPVAVLLLSYDWQRRGAVAERSAALGVFDRQLALKDRLTTSDQFLRQPAPDGFRAAALAEADGWIERALSTPLVAPAPPRARRGDGRSWSVRR